jgi:hypothetical protein
MAVIIKASGSVRPRRQQIPVELGEPVGDGQLGERKAM